MKESGMLDLLHALQETLAEEIPITRHIGVRVQSYDGERLILQAPLEQNINHKGTAFAGSLNALATLAGWGQLWLILKEQNIRAKIVIQDSSSNYLFPVTGDFTAICYKPDAYEIVRMQQTLRKRGKARIELFTEIYDNHVIAVSFKGRYVVLVHE
jgi:thioesterase domain-containing protein